MAQPKPTSSIKTARLLLLSLLVVLLAVILAPPRYLVRLGSLTQQLRQIPFPRNTPPPTAAPRFLTTMASGKYDNPPQRPPVFNYTPEQLASTVDDIIAKKRAAIDKVVAATTPENATFENTLEPILRGEDELTGPGWRAAFVRNAHGDAAVREASNTAEGKMQDVDVELRMRDDIFQRVNSVYKNKDAANFNTERSTILRKEQKAYVDKGLLLPAGPQRDRFKEIQIELGRKCLECQANNNNEVGGFWVTPEQLDGISKTDIDPDQLEKGTGENEGKVKLNFKYTTSVPLSKYANSAELRRDYLIAESNKVRHQY